jgi:hypothetical protein
MASVYESSGGVASAEHAKMGVTLGALRMRIGAVGECDGPAASAQWRPSTLPPVAGLKALRAMKAPP